MAKRPNVFTMTLSPEHRAELEDFRRKVGARSEADAVRTLIHWRRVVEYQINGRSVADMLGQPEGPFKMVHDPALDVDIRDHRAAIETPAPAVQIGPITPPPGSRLKQPKGKAK